MNIHFIAGVRVPTPRGHKVSKDGTKPPRTREGLKIRTDNRHNFPGGKALRRAKANLERRLTDFNSMRDTSGYSKPGSMAK